MKLVGFKVFNGRSVYSHRKCIKLNLDLEDYEDVTTNYINNFNKHLIDILPELSVHCCSLGEEGGFQKRLNDGTHLHHLCGHIAIALQNRLQLDVSFCSESKLNSTSCYTIYEYKYKNTAIETGKLAIDIINSIIGNKSLNLRSRLEILKSILKAEEENSMLSDSISKKVIRSVPVISITGTNGKTTTTRLIAYTLSKAGYKVGMTTTDGIFINGDCIYEGDTTGPRSALDVLSNSDIDVAVLETARGGLVRNGLAYDLADVSVITNVTDDHLGLDGIETLEDLAKAKMLVVEAVKKDGYVVINGDNEITAGMVTSLKSKPIIFSQNKDNEVLINSIKNRGFGIYIYHENLCIESQDFFLSLINVKDIGITFNGILKYNIQNAMAACGALIGFGIEPSIIKEALESFQCSEELNPGRFNVFNIDGILIILDYGHNIDGYNSVLEGLIQIKHKRLIGVIGVPGDRLDRTTLEVGRIAGNYLNLIFIKEDKDLRGRRPGEVAALLKEGILTSGFNSTNLRVILDEEAALNEAMNSASTGDIVIVFFENYAPLLRLVKERSIKVIQKSN